jgi:hypothetical protein
MPRKKREPAPAPAPALAAPPSAPALPEGVVWKGNPRLIPSLVPIGSLHEDPANVNTHPERSVAVLAGSYARFGQRRPIVCDKDLVVRDGNGQLLAARERLGWTHIACLPDDLDGVEMTAYALAVNRTAQHSEMDFEALAETLKAIRDSGAPIDDLGWADYELDPLLAAEWTPPPSSDGGLGGFPGGDGGPDMAAPVRLTKDQRGVFEQALGAIRSEHGGDVSEGRAVELLSADYLAGAPYGGARVGGESQDTVE